MTGAEEMAAIHAAAYRQARPWSGAEFRDLMASPLVFALGDARAFALIRVVADETELLTIATRPDHQRQGLARALMADWLAAATRRGARHAFLEVARDNAPARALYGACGFAECGLRRGYYARPDGPSADAVVMARSLTEGQAETG